MTKLFQDIETFIKSDPSSWCIVEKAHALAATILASRPTVCVEVGTFRGNSAIPIAMALREIGQGTLYCVDPWSAAASEAGQVTDADREWWKNLNYETVYGDFVERLKQYGLSHYVSIQRMRSGDFTPPDNMGFWHCDGNHGPDAVLDVVQYAPRVAVGGYAYLDDLNWSGGYTARAADKIAELGFVRLYNVGTGAMFQRIA